MAIYHPHSEPMGPSSLSFVQIAVEQQFLLQLLLLLLSLAVYQEKSQEKAGEHTYSLGIITSCSHSVDHSPFFFFSEAISLPLPLFT